MISTHPLTIPLSLLLMMNRDHIDPPLLISARVSASKFKLQSAPILKRSRRPLAPSPKTYKGAQLDALFLALVHSLQICLSKLHSHPSLTLDTRGVNEKVQINMDRPFGWITMLAAFSSLVRSAVLGSLGTLRIRLNFTSRDIFVR